MNIKISLFAAAVFLSLPAFSADLPANSKTVVKGKVEKLQFMGNGRTNVVVALPPAQGKTWGERMEIPWGKNFIKDGKPMDQIGNISVYDDVAIVTDTTHSKVTKTLPGNPASPKIVEEVTSSSVVKVYIGRDASAINTDVTVSPPAEKKPLEKPKSTQEIREGIKTKADAKKALRQYAITGEEYLVMIKALPD